MRYAGGTVHPPPSIEPSSSSSPTSTRLEGGEKRPHELTEMGDSSIAKARTSKAQKTKQFNDYRQYLQPLLPFVRFPLMDPQYFSSKVLPIEILPSSTFIPILQFLCHHSVPDVSELDKVCIAKRRSAQIIRFCEVGEMNTDEFPHGRAGKGVCLWMHSPIQRVRCVALRAQLR